MLLLEQSWIVQPLKSNATIKILTQIYAYILDLLIHEIDKYKN